ncbi:MAG: DUF4238 domain-containing protein [Fluviicoccus sp.]|uniref:DUF4238 domain-containing protein n=1 Tax=Fluviicoccus sp. TaxID=2003552 RepID=UPI0027276E6C|nr:DUF4238 domain-containing protein [Fluviicoccus sp.]MDO8330873.1 DUF4238 domain-containing protein [Fluviicoccus sp.]
MQKKKSQHFVSQFYLKAWSACGEKVYTNINNAPVLKSTKQVACSNYFYKIDKINKSGFEILLGLNEKTVFPLKGLFEKLIYCSYMFSLAELIDLDEQDTKRLDAFRTNIIEDFYCIIENGALEAIDIILNKKYDSFDLNGYQDMLRFAVYQLTRTSKTRENIRVNIQGALESKGIDFKEYQTISTLLLSEQITLALIEKLYKIVIIENKTNVDFITSDNPVKNLRSVDEHDVELFVPISPTMAILIMPSEKSQEEKDSIKQLLLKSEAIPNYYFGFKDECSVGEIENINKLTSSNKERFIFTLKAEDVTKYQ